MFNQTLIACLASAAVAGAGAYKWQANAYESKLAAQELTYLRRDFRALEIAHAETISLQTRKDAAELKAVARIRAATSDAAVLRDSISRLSDTADTALRESGDSLATCLSHGATVTELFKDCAGRYRQVGEQAQGWLDETLTLREAYPIKAAVPELQVSPVP